MDKGLLNHDGEKIRISGDEAKMSRIANFIVLSFSVISDEEQAMSAYSKKQSISIESRKLCSKLCNDIIGVLLLDILFKHSYYMFNRKSCFCCGLRQRRI